MLEDFFGGLQQTEGYVLTAIISIIAAGCLYNIWRCYKLQRYITDTPTSRIHSAALGFVELDGTAIALPGETVTGALTQKPCLWWRYSIEKRYRTNKGTRWRTVDSGESSALFALDDNSGQCIVDPVDAKVISQHRDTWHGSSSHPNRQAPSGLGSLIGGYRYTEERIESGDKLYALGDYRSTHPSDDINLEELIKERLSDWKSNQQELLAKFDRNRDGAISENEWERVHLQAKREAQQQLTQLRRQKAVTVIGAPADGKPFILSTTDESGLVKRYKIGLTFSIIGFIAFATVSYTLIKLYVM